MKIAFHIRKLTSIVLLLVLLQKSGANLCLHNSLHNSLHVSHINSSAQLPELNNSTAHCNCIDDFYMPFEPAATASITIPETPYSTVGFQYTDDTYSTTLFHYSLRGPPAMRIAQHSC